jgi:hypothetical protein
MKIDGFPANFSISEPAKAQIGTIRTAYLERFPHDPPTMLMVGWGAPPGPDGLPDHELGNVAVGFYLQSEFGPEKRHLAETVSGLTLIYAVGPDQYSMFDGKVVDYSDERKFFLR